MSVLLSVALVTASHFQPSCSWDRPGANRYTGSSAAAIERYTDIPEQVRNTLKRRIAEQQSDDQVRITRDAIRGKSQYEPGIRDMHFGTGSVCRSVTRNKWTVQRQEPGAVYCVGEHCILVPRICGNISRITRLPAAALAYKPSGLPPLALAQQAASIEPLPAARTLLAQGGAPATPASHLGDSFGAHDSGKAVAAPEEAPLAADDSQARQRAPGRVAQENEGIDQPNFTSNDDGNSKGQFGRLPGWPGDVGHSDGGPMIPPSPVNPPSPVPEADSWAMLLAGLVLLGAVARRRRSKA